MSRYAYFGVPNIGAQLLPDDPGAIYDLAMNYKRTKGNVDATKQGLLGKPKQSFMQKVDGVVSDIGSATGLGMTMLGAKLNQYEPTRKVGTALKTHGVDTLISDDKKRMYGVAIPTGAAIGAGIGISNALDEDYD